VRLSLDVRHADEFIAPSQFTKLQLFEPKLFAANAN